MMIGFRQLAIADMPMLHEWLQRPHVAEGYIALTRVQTDPDPGNVRAIRCYEDAGLRAVGEVDTPDGRALLMMCTRATGGIR
jgi:RimJ/RimL family protein N-acetyltransferase